MISLHLVYQLRELEDLLLHCKNRVVGDGVHLESRNGSIFGCV